MLKTIPNILSPDLLKIMMEMGHGDELVIADGNFPSASIAKRLVRLDGHGVPDVLKAILRLFPLDTYTESPVVLMKTGPKDEKDPPIWQEYEKIIRGSGEPFSMFNYIDRFGFYEHAKRSYAVIATGEPALYANIIIKKGVVK